jgi:deoxyadenosine/deoxycytidine kinase
MFVLEGNIGSGKSTLLKKLKDKYPRVNVVLEPVDEWIDFKNNNNQSIFQLFYENPEKYAFAFQMYVMLTRLKKLECVKCDTIYERSIMTDKHIFMTSLKQDNTISDIEYKVFNDWFEYLYPKVESVKGIIYLQVDPELCFNRIEKRNRTSENNISIEYLTTIHNNHEIWLKNSNSIKSIIVNGNDDSDLENIMAFVRENS